MKPQRLSAFLFLALGFTWFFWIPDALVKRGFLPETLWTNIGFVGAFGPLVAALYCTYHEEGKAGVKKLLQKGITLTFGWSWWLIIFLLFPILILLAYKISIATDRVIPSFPAASLYPLLPFIFFSVMLTAGPVQEEFGWRGYALPRLQARYSPFWVSLILGFIWAIWHWPQFLVPPEKTGMFYVTPFWSFILTVISANFVYTWVYNHTRGSLLGILFLHTQMNLSFWILPVLSTRTGHLWVLVFFALTSAGILVYDRKNFFRKPAETH